MAAFFQILGGLALFLYGVRLLSAGMEKLTGEQIQKWLERVTSGRLRSALFGTAARLPPQPSRSHFRAFEENTFGPQRGTKSSKKKEGYVAPKGLLCVFCASLWPTRLLVSRPAQASANSRRRSAERFTKSLP